MASESGSRLSAAAPAQPKMCPSAQPDMANATVLGVVEGDMAAPRLSYVVEPLAVTAELLAQTGDVRPTQVFRFAATCEEKACRHFDGQDCKLATRIVALLEPVVAALPPCRIRPTCRWHAQEGREACLRCPQVVTESASRDEAYRAAALGPQAHAAAGPQNLGPQNLGRQVREAPH